MDVEQVSAWRTRIGTVGTGRACPPPCNLTAGERSAFVTCAAENLRIEQERFPQAFVTECLKSQFAE